MLTSAGFDSDGERDTVSIPDDTEPSLTDRFSIFTNFKLRNSS